MIRTYQSLPPKKNVTAFMAWIWMLMHKEGYLNIDEMRYDPRFKMWRFQLAHKYYPNERKETFVKTDTLYDMEYRIWSHAKEKELL